MHFLWLNLIIYTTVVLPLYTLGRGSRCRDAHTAGGWSILPAPGSRGPCGNIAGFSPLASCVKLSNNKKPLFTWTGHELDMNWNLFLGGIRAYEHRHHFIRLNMLNCNVKRKPFQHITKLRLGKCTQGSFKNTGKEKKISGVTAVKGRCGWGCEKTHTSSVLVWEITENPRETDPG